MEGNVSREDLCLEVSGVPVHPPELLENPSQKLCIGESDRSRGDTRLLSYTDCAYPSVKKSLATIWRSCPYYPYLIHQFIYLLCLPTLRPPGALLFTLSSPFFIFFIKADNCSKIYIHILNYFHFHF